MCDGVIGYYGSRIRDYVEIIPKCPVLLFFPSKDESFDVEKLIGTLKGGNVDIHILDGRHGFSDSFSKSYCELSDYRAKKLADDFLSKISIT